MVSQFMGVYKEHNFVHDLNSQIPEANVAKLPVRLCGRWAEFVEGKSKRSTWESLANWLEKEAKICESKQRWMPEKREWRRFDSTKSDLPKCGSRRSASNPVPGLFAGTTRDTPSVDEKLKDLDLKDTDTGPVRLIIGSDNSDLILPMRIVKPSGQSHA